jgi:mannosyltransferase
VTVLERAPARDGEPAGEPATLGRIVRAGGTPLVAIVLIGAALRFATLDLQSFSDDELFTVWLVKMPFSDMLSTVPNTEATPHLFYVLEWVSTQVFGAGEVGARVLPALAGLLTVPVVYAAAAIAASRRAALAAAAFAAVNPFLIWYSQEARAYALLILLSALSLTWLLAYVRWGRRSALVGWAVAAALALLTHYFALFLVLPEAVWLLFWATGPRRPRVYAVLVPALTGLALLPLALHQRDTVGDPGGLAGLGFGERVAAVPKNFLVGFSIPAEGLMVTLAALAAAVALVLAVQAVRQGGGSGVLLVAGLGAGGVVLAVVLAPLGFDYVSSRNLVGMLAVVAIVLGYGFAHGRGGPVALGVLCAVSIATVVGVDGSSAYQRRDWRGAAQALGPAQVPRLVSVNPPFHNAGPFGVYFGSDSRVLRGVPGPVGELALVALASGHSFGPTTPKPPAGPAPKAPPGFHLAEDKTTSTYRVVRFTAPRPLAVPPAYLPRLAFLRTPAVLVVQPAQR